MTAALPRGFLVIVLAACGAACGGGAKSPSAPADDPPAQRDSMMMTMTSNQGMAPDAASRFGPLEVGADWQSYTKLNRASFPSETHGGRLVDAYVNELGLAAFKAGEDMPVGSIVVKTSRDARDGSEGPVFVMEKRAPGANPEHGDWWFAIHWAKPPPRWAEKLGGPVYWRTPSPKANYCAGCHDDFVTGIGGVPEDQQAW